MATKCIKLAIYPIDKLMKKDDIYQELRDISYKTRKACNYAMNLQYQELMRKSIEKQENNFVTDEKMVYNGHSFAVEQYNLMVKQMDGCYSGNISQTQQFVKSKSNFDTSKILKGEVSLTTFKNNIPVMIYNKAYTLRVEDDDIYSVETSLFTLGKQKELGCKRVKFAFLNPDDSCKVILNRIMRKEYKQGSAQIQYNERKRKWMMTISFSFEPEIKQLDKNKILGVDLGITKTSTMSVYNTETEKYDRLSWKENSIDGTELIHYRQKEYARRKSMSIATKWSSENKTGHGTKKRMDDIEKLGDKSARFRDTYNHKVSRYIVDLAIKHNCGVIQMEDLSGFSSEQSESLLANWSYYDLQQKVKYKAEEVGIIVVFINPKYTSKRCSKCGNIHIENRNCKENQAKFKCVSCGHEENADINASKNIAIPSIDLIIDEYIKTHKIA